MTEAPAPSVHNPLDAESAIAAIGDQMNAVLEAKASAQDVARLAKYQQQPTVPANAPPLPSEPPETEGDTEDAEQASPVSSEPADDDEDERPTPRTWRVKADDAEFEATEDEVLKLASAGKNYTRRSQQLAADKKAFEAEAQAVKAERAKYAQELATLEAQIQALKPAEPNWEYLRATDPQAYSVAVADWTRLQVEEQKVSAKKAEAQAKVAADKAADVQAQAREQQARLLEIIPEWQKPDVAQRELTAMYALAKQRGMTDEQIGVVANDPVAVAMFRDAWRHTEAQKMKPVVQEIAERRVQAVKTMSPGSASAPQTASKRSLKEGDALVRRLKETGGVHEAAAVFNKMFPE